MFDEERKANVLIGVVSWGKRCGSMEDLGIYAKVDHVLPWINKIITKYANNSFKIPAAVAHNETPVANNKTTVANNIAARNCY